MNSLKDKLAHYAWDIAYGTYTDRIISEGLREVKINIVKNTYKNKWFADPFILDEDENIIQFLVEEFDYDVKRGRIARLKVNKKNKIIEECSIILDLSTHLSFPVIYRLNGEVYVHPENSASGASYIYRYDKYTDKLVEAKLMVEEPIADAVIRKDGNIYRMYATRVPETNGCVLHEYSSDYLFGPYTHECEHTFEKNTARMAGMFLTTVDGRLIRPAQDCFGGYGRAVILYDNHKQICRIEPTSCKYAGVHTFNVFQKSFVLDFKKYDYPLFYKLRNMLKQ